MNRILVIGNDSELQRDLLHELEGHGFVVLSLPYDAARREAIDESRPDVVLLNMTGPDGDVLGRGLLRHHEFGRFLPVIAVIEPGLLERLDPTMGVQDFITAPLRPGELLARIRHALWHNAGVDAENTIRVRDLVIDLANYRVYVAGRPIELTYKEYELLRFLAQNRDKVFTREALLNRVWGYGYFGGGRTVDVHIRRLRSKIEDSEHTFIETVRNVGYRIPSEEPGRPREASGG